MNSTLLAANILPLSDETSVKASVLIQKVELGVLCVPLHKVYLQFELISSPVIVGVRPTLSVNDIISLILGNNLAGGKVKLNHGVNDFDQLVSSVPVSDGLSEQIISSLCCNEGCSMKDAGARGSGLRCFTCITSNH